jgi:hypothetical protein
MSASPLISSRSWFQVRIAYLSDGERGRFLQEAQSQSGEARTQVGLQAEHDERDIWAVSLGYALPLFLVLA